MNGQRQFRLKRLAATCRVSCETACSISGCMMQTENFALEVGTRAVTKQPAAGVSPGAEPEDPSVRKRRVTDGESEE